MTSNLTPTPASLAAMGAPAQYLRPRAAADFLKKHFGHGSAATLARLRCLGGGPRFYRVGRKLVCYAPADLVAWGESKISKPLESTSEGPAYRPYRTSESKQGGIAEAAIET